MPKGDKTKEQAFPMWLAGKTLQEIQQTVCKPQGSEPSSVRGWIVDWERGKQKTWEPLVK